jgi:hypothetical protein
MDAPEELREGGETIVEYEMTFTPNTSSTSASLRLFDNLDVGCQPGGGQINSRCFTPS